MAFRQYHEMSSDELAILAEQGDMQARERLDLRRVARKLNSPPQLATWYCTNCGADFLAPATLDAGCPHCKAGGQYTYPNDYFPRYGKAQAHEAMRPIEDAVSDAIKRKVGTIDLTPTWSAVLPMILYALECGTEEGKRLAKLELANMAKAADAYNKMVPK